MVAVSDNLQGGEEGTGTGGGKRGELGLLAVPTSERRQTGGDILTNLSQVSVTPPFGP